MGELGGAAVDFSTGSVTTPKTRGAVGCGGVERIEPAADRVRGHGCLGMKRGKGGGDEDFGGVGGGAPVEVHGGGPLSRRCVLFFLLLASVELGTKLSKFAFETPN